MKNRSFSAMLKENRILLLILLIAVGLSIFYGFQKKGLFLDELYSYGLANSYYTPFVEDVKGGNFIDTVLTRQELNDYMTVGANERFAYDSVYYNQSMDVHPPLFYALLHTVCSFFPGVYSKWFGLGLNVAIYAVTLVLLYKTLHKLFADKKIALFSVFMYAVSHAGLSTANMIRMYMLLTLFTVLFAYFLLCLLEKNKWYYHLGLGVTIFGGLFTQYYFVFYAFFACAAVGVYFLAKKEIKRAVLFSVSAISGVAVMYICYPVCIEHLFADKVVSGASAVSNLTNLSIYGERIYGFVKDLFDSSTAAVMLSVAALVVVPWKFKKKASAVSGGTEKKVLILFVPGVLAFLISAIISPYPIIRYIYNIIPILLLLPVYLFHRLYKHVKEPARMLRNAVVVTAVISLISLIGQPPTWLYSNYAEYDNIMKQQQGKPCIYLTRNVDFGVLSDVNQLYNFDEVFITDRLGSASLKNYVMEKDTGEGIVVYIENEVDLKGLSHDEAVEILAERFGYATGQTLFWDKDFSKAYLLTN